MNAIITAATKGIGKAITLALAGAGYNVAICSRSQSEIDSFCTELSSRFNIKAVGIETNVADPAQLQRFASFVQQHFATVDVLVNNAGTYIPAFILDEEDTVFQRQMEVNFYPAYYLCKFFGKKMRDFKSGNIFNICSIASKNPVISAGSYSVTKAALLSLTHVLREELMPHHVKVTAVLPGSTLTDSWKGTDIPSERFVSADDVAKAVLSILQMSVGANVDELIIIPLAGEI
ncbi:SDR family NAD(P)-dependent oxidoreductase [Rubrolithibacter danxiaensis]|uniref:SDR family NAD(P)-dependent oxidoreductase n=1 Tax=Rubrolithibacter danxiaensis TaxID=3390805 RepID=UPI003BF9151A